MRRALCSFFVIMFFCCAVLAAQRAGGGQAHSAVIISDNTPASERYNDVPDWSLADLRPAYERYERLTMQLAEMHSVQIEQMHAVYVALHTSNTTSNATLTSFNMHINLPTVAIYPTGSVNGHPCGGNLPNCCTLTHESDGQNVANPNSSASGYWQFLTSTFDNVTGLSGPAMSYSASVQDSAAVRLYAGGAGWENWKGDGCYPGG